MIEEPEEKDSSSRQKPNSAARPDHDLRAEPREVHRAGRGGGEVVEDEVAVGGAVDRVGADVLEAEVVGDRAAVDLPVDAGQGARAERHHRGAVEGELEAQDVAGEHPEVGEQVVAEVDRLGALQVGVAGHRPVAVALGQLEQAPHRRPGQLDRPQRVRLHDHRHVGRDLVVARAAGVELAGQRADLLAEQPLDRHVDVLVGLLELEAVLPDPLAHAVEPAADPLQLILVEHADLAQRPRVRLRLVDVVRRQPPIELDRAIEAPEARVRVFAEAGHQRSDSARASHTRATCDSLIAGKNGSASDRAEAASATGNWPSRQPSSRRWGKRWMQGR